ncbi:TetR/AcrR family transcriptional regulator [Nonomuraea sp. NPDC052265]|uniref:TetR/AcrR family transcriptional regulator n=1 Tax=Nonomuraea sp. NPDC052265 TaxID=3364374 RepID=UPI0037C8F38A
MLTRHKILEAGLEVLEADGAHGISMRKLAKRLDVTATAIYHYFDGRESLLEAIVDEVCSNIVSRAPREGGWKDQLRGLMDSMVRQSLEHPRASVWSITTYARRAPVMSLHEAIFGILLDAGFPPDQADHVKGAVLRVCVGHLVLHEAAARDWTELPADKYPHYRAVEAARRRADQVEHFRFALDAVLAGLPDPNHGGEPAA